MAERKSDETVNLQVKQESLQLKSVMIGDLNKSKSELHLTGDLLASKEEDSLKFAFDFSNDEFSMSQPIKR